MLTIVLFPISWVLVALLGAQATPAADPTVASYPSAAVAVQAILADKTQVVAFGEYHQQKKTAKIPSALKLEKDPSIQAQDWYKQYRKAYRPRRVFVIERGPRSYALVFARRR